MRCALIATGFLSAAAAATTTFAFAGEPYLTTTIDAPIAASESGVPPPELRLRAIVARALDDSIATWKRLVAADALEVGNVNVRFVTHLAPVQLLRPLFWRWAGLLQRQCHRVRRRRRGEPPDVAVRIGGRGGHHLPHRARDRPPHPEHLRAVPVPRLRGAVVARAIAPNSRAASSSRPIATRACGFRRATRGQSPTASGRTCARSLPASATTACSMRAASPVPWRVCTAARSSACAGSSAACKAAACRRAIRSPPPISELAVA